MTTRNNNGALEGRWCTSGLLEKHLTDMRFGTSLARGYLVPGTSMTPKTTSPDGTLVGITGIFILSETAPSGRAVARGGKRERSDDENTTTKKGGCAATTTKSMRADQEDEEGVVAASGEGIEEDGGMGELPQGRPTQRPVLVRICLGGTAQQLLPLEMVRREHPQLLINYLLSVTQVR